MQNHSQNGQKLVFFHKQEMLNLNYGTSFNYCINQVKLKQLLDLWLQNNNTESVYSNDIISIKPFISPSVIIEDVSKPFYAEQFTDINFLTNKIKELNDIVKDNTQLSDKPKI